MHELKQVENKSVYREKSVCEHVASSLIPEQQQAIREQLDRLLLHPLFSHSKRYPSFLRFIVEKTLAGHVEELKERIIGVEVFQRAADYDTNDSPIVRVTAGEVRKRLELYYHEPGREHEIRVELPTGGYLPAFHAPGTSATVASRSQHASFSGVIEEDELGIRSVSAPDLPVGLFRSVSYPALWLAIVAVVVLSSAFFYRATRADSVVDQFWSEVVNSQRPVVLCLARGTGGNGAPPTSDGVGILLPDVETMSSIRDTLQAHKREFRVINAASDLTDLKNDPVVFVGPFHSPWVKQMTASLRYRILHETGAPTISIQDSQDPSRQPWVEKVDPNRTESRAILARFIDKDAARPVVIATGLSPQATVAAGEVLTNPQYMNDLLSAAPKDWQKMNLEAVIRTQIVNGAAGPPQIEAVYFWE